MGISAVNLTQKRAAVIAWGVALAWAIGGMALPAAAQDGELVWARAMGGADFDAGQSIAVDGAGNVYITGSFAGTMDFDPGPDSFELTSVGNDDIFVLKLDADGNFLWARAMGGPDDDTGWDIAVDGAGNTYITGQFLGTVDFDPGPETFNLTNVANDDIFVQKMDTNGNFLWARAMGGTNINGGFGIAVDSAGNVYTTGSFAGTVDFDPGPDSFELTSAEFSDIFVQKMDTNGNFVWARSMDGTGFERGQAIAVDSAGNVYTTGFFEGTVDFDPGPGTSEFTTSPFVSDIFVQKLDTDGNFVWARAIGGTNNDEANDIAVDGVGNVYTTGEFAGTVDFDPGPDTFDLTTAGGIDIFVQKLDTDGNFVWARAVGGTGFDFGIGVAVDSAGNVYTTGGFFSTADFDPGPDTFNLTSEGDLDIFVNKLDADGNFLWARGMGSASTDIGRGIAVDSAGNAYITGRFRGTVDFDPGSGTFDLTSAGFDDIFVQKLSGSPSVPAIPGDVNTDGEVNAIDVQLAINAALGIGIDPGFNADINGDSAVNAIDVQLVINAALGIAIDP